MEFNPNNFIVKLCVQGMELEAKGAAEGAAAAFLQAWNRATDDFEKFLAAYFVARQQPDAQQRLTWLQTALERALKSNSKGVKSALASVYASIAACYEELGDEANALPNRELAASHRDQLTDPGPFYHGTRADLPPRALLTPGHDSNYSAGLSMNHIYFTALVDGAGLAAALAKGDGLERVYVVEPTGPFENDPNVTDKKFPGNLTRSYRSTAPLKILGEALVWNRMPEEALQQFREKLANSKGAIIN